ncbi:MobV family relaxase [Bacillus paramycoides]|uniref:MobV family relaxase n=1 Tax=Bacillus paramycoides TaxID=2026194 RepID=UPI003D01BE77
MSYAVVRMAKMKSHDLKGIQFHNQRERESKTNPDIDKEKSKDNYDLVNDKNIDYNEHVKEIIESQKTGARKTRKDAVLVNEFIVTSDRYFFENLTPNETKEFFEKAKEFFAERYGEKNVAYGVVHLDEQTPHMHLGVVPMKDGRLQGKNVFNRNELLTLQDEFPKHMQKKGFDLERGEKGSTRKHLETTRFKLEQTKQELEDVVKEKEQTVTDVKIFKEPKQVLDKVEGSTKKALFGDKVSLPSSEFDKLKDLAMSSVKTKYQLDKVKSAADTKIEDLEARVQLADLRADNAEMQFGLLEKEVDKLREQQKNAIIYQSMLQDTNRDLEIGETEREGRWILFKLEKGHEPRNREEGEHWLSILEKNKRDRTIPEKRLEGFIGFLKGILDKLLGKEKKFSQEGLKGLSEQSKTQKQKSKSRGHTR